MSTNSGQATQTAQVVATASTEAAPTATTTASTKAATGENLRNKILQLLAKVGPNQCLTIRELQEQLGVASTDAKGRNVVQSTVSQMRQQGKVAKVATGNRMPGYTLPAPKA